MKTNRSTRQDNISAYILILPFFIFFFIFVIVPIFYTIYQSFTDFTGLSPKSNFIGFENYTRIFSDKTFIKSLQNTIIYAVFSVFPVMILGMITAIVLNKQNKFFVFIRAVLVFPYITSMVAVSMIWLIMFEPTNGILNSLLSTFGLKEFKWLYDTKLALPCLIFVNVWKNVGYVMLIYLSGLQGIPTHLYEAAKVDGASSFKMMFHITLPMLKPISIFVFITMMIESFKTFDQVRVMTDGNPLMATTTVVHQIYLRAFSEFKYGYSAAMSVVLLIIIFIVTLINMRLTGINTNNQ